MRKLFLPLFAILLALLLCGCSNDPDSLQLDLSRGYGSNLKLLHLNANSPTERTRIENFASAIQNASKLEKDASLFANYPDYLLSVKSAENSELNFSVVIDLNGDFLDFYYPDYPETLYRSEMTVDEFKKLVHRT